MRAFVTNLPSADSLRVMQFSTEEDQIPSLFLFFVEYIHKWRVLCLPFQRVRQRQRKTDIERHREKQAKTDKGILFIFDEMKKKKKKK